MTGGSLATPPHRATRAMGAHSIMEVLCRSLDVKLEAAESSFEDDKRRILNTIARRRVGLV